MVPESGYSARPIPTLICKDIIFVGNELNLTASFPGTKWKVGDSFISTSDKTPDIQKLISTQIYAKISKIQKIIKKKL